MHNTIIWKTDYIDRSNHYADAKWRFKMYDMDACLRGTSEEDYLVTLLNQTVDVDSSTYFTAVLFQKLWGNRQFRNDFKNRFIDILSNKLSKDILLNKFDRMIQELSHDMIYNIDKLHRGYKQENLLDGSVNNAIWEENNNKIRNFLQVSTDYFIDYWEKK